MIRREKLVLQFEDAPLVEAVGFLGGVILGVLGEIAVTARLGDELNDAVALLARAPF